MATPTPPVAAEAHSVFVYGSLMADEVACTILKRIPPSAPVLLPDHHWFNIKGRIYPAILPAEGKKVPGKDVEYKRTRVEISLLRSFLQLKVISEQQHEQGAASRVGPRNAAVLSSCGSSDSESDLTRDFLTRSYGIGGVISVMAFSGLFILMTQYGLEYPKFYEKLYALLTPAVFMAKHRSVFLQLLDTCLKSSYLPAYLAAAFAKRLSRLALSVPPA